MSKHPFRLATESGASADDFCKLFAALAAKDERARTNLRPDRVPACLSGGDRAQEPHQETRRTPRGARRPGLLAATRTCIAQVRVTRMPSDSMQTTPRRSALDNTMLLRRRSPT
jgi:hypothetical protein